MSQCGSLPAASGADLSHRNRNCDVISLVIGELQQTVQRAERGHQRRSFQSDNRAILLRLHLLLRRVDHRISVMLEWEVLELRLPCAVDKPENDTLCIRARRYAVI